MLLFLPYYYLEICLLWVLLFLHLLVKMKEHLDLFLLSFNPSLIASSLPLDWHFFVYLFLEYFFVFIIQLTNVL
jgi:hypothetical protein